MLYVYCVCTCVDRQVGSQAATNNTFLYTFSYLLINISTRCADPGERLLRIS